jgi:hypothetical protein
MLRLDDDLISDWLERGEADSSTSLRNGNKRTGDDNCNSNNNNNSNDSGNSRSPSGMTTIEATATATATTTANAGVLRSAQNDRYLGRFLAVFGRCLLGGGWA